MIFNSNNSPYQIGGSLADHHPTYVERDADDKLFQAVLMGKLCYISNARQTGKSSLKVQIIYRLREQGLISLDINLQGLVETGMSSESFYFTLCKEIIDNLPIEFDLNSWWQQQSNLSRLYCFQKFIEEVALQNNDNNIVIFIDEIDRLQDFTWCGDFLGLIRSFHDSRSTKHQYKRLTFVLIGVATPNELIQDTRQSPFNIGTEIELEGFRFEEVTPLINLLGNTIDNPEIIMGCILYWTGGQPFLTQRLCQLVSQSEPIPVGDENKTIEELVKREIIDKWERADQQHHFKAIEEKIVNNSKSNINLLENYRNILESQEIPSSSIDNDVLLQLRLSGIIAKKQGKIKVFNNIYQEVFNQTWIESKLDKIRFYDPSMKAWYQSGEKDGSKLLRGTALEEAIKLRQQKTLSSRDERYINASQEMRYGRNLKRIGLVAISLITGIVGTGMVLNVIYASCPIGERIIQLDNLSNSPCSRFIVSSGEQNKLFLSSTNFKLEQGVEYFKQKDYVKAQEAFQEAHYSDPADPVPLIYYNNARARARTGHFIQKNPHKIAVVVPIDAYEDVAKEILRGAADAQHEFNNQGGYKGRLLEIIIANDENNERLIRKVAQDLASQKDILGVLGHQASESSEAALPFYEKSKLALVSGNSSSSKLNHKEFPNFFRTISSTKSATEIYTQYITEYLSLKKIAIFYTQGSLYSETLRDDIEKAFQGEKKRICMGDAENPDSKDCQLDIPRQLALLRKENYKAAFLISSVKTNSLALVIARYNLQLPKELRLQLIGAMTLSETATVEKGGEALEGMTIVSPCTPSSAYMTDSAKRWQQKKIQWRTATTYDAAQALIAAIKKSGDNPTREEVLKNLPLVSLSPQETSGVAVDWFNSEAPESNLNRKYCLYEIKDGIFKEKYLNKINNNERD